MILSVKQTEHGLVVLVQKPKKGGGYSFTYSQELEWVSAGQDEFNEICARLMRESDLSRSGWDKQYSDGPMVFPSDDLNSLIRQK